jgi:hypothetical protein
LWTCITDFVPFKIERGECLCGVIDMHMRWMNGELISLYSAVIHWLNVVHLQHRFRCLQDSAWWVPILNNIDAYENDEWRSNRTVFCCNPPVKCCAPVSPIWFERRSSVVSVYIELYRCIWDGWIENELYFILL